MTKVGVVVRRGSEGPTSSDNMVLEAIESGSIKRPKIIFAFITNDIDPFRFLNGIRDVVGEGVPVVGGSAIGVISNSSLSYKEFTSGIVVIESDTIDFSVSWADKIDANEEDAGRRLINEVSKKHKGVGKLFNVFYDSIKAPPTQEGPPIMNSSTYLLKGIEKGLNRNIPIVGAGLVGDYGLNPTFQFCGFHIANQHVVGLMLDGDFNAHFRITHGCTPLDGVYHTITRIEGPVLYELDGKNIVKIINDMLGDETWQGENPVDFLTIGVNYGEKYGVYNEGLYVSRLIAGVTPDRQGVVLFEPDLEEGMEVQFMTRDTEKMVESARKNANHLLASIKEKNERPVFGFYIDCAGRAGGYLNTDIEEAWEIQNAFNAYNIPLFGFYSGVEIAPLLGRSRGLDWTGVLTVLTENG